MQDVDAKRWAFRSGPRSHETHAVLTDNRTDSLRRGDDSHVGRLRSNKARQRRRGSPWVIRSRGAARPASSLRPAYYLACNMMWSSSTTRHVGWLRWVLTLWPDGLDTSNPFLPNQLASPPHGSPPRFMVISSFSGAIEATPARSIFRSSLGLAKGDQNWLRPVPFVAAINPPP